MLAKLLVFALSVCSLARQTAIPEGAPVSYRMRRNPGANR